MGLGCLRTGGGEEALDCGSLPLQQFIDEKEIVFVLSSSSAKSNPLIALDLSYSFLITQQSRDSTYCIVVE